MQVSVGSVIHFRNQDWICTKIIKLQSTSFARQDSAIWRAERERISNCKHVVLEIDSFAEGDVINVDYEYVELQVPGKDLFFLYNYYKVKKESLDGQQGSKAAVEQSSSDEAQGTGQGDQSGTSAGAPPPSADSEPVHEDGRSGEERDPLYPRDSA